MGWLDLIVHAADSTLRSVMGMRAKFILRRQEQPAPSATQKARRLASVNTEIVKSRPLMLEERYALADSDRSIDDVFIQLRHALFEDCDAISTEARQNGVGRIIGREVGKTAEGRLFMYFKPFSDFGWLIERSGPGWRINRAEKIVSEKMFLRAQGDPWDLVLLYKDPAGVGSLRLKSHRFGGVLMTLAVYEQRMRDVFTAELVGRLNH